VIIERVKFDVEFRERQKKIGHGRVVVQPCERAQEVYQKDGRGIKRWMESCPLDTYG